jgi:hypothetical protein
VLKAVLNLGTAASLSLIDVSPVGEGLVHLGRPMGSPLHSLRRGNALRFHRGERLFI